MIASRALGQVLDAPEEFDSFGRRSAAGDFNADGYADLAISAHEEGLLGVERNGAVHVLYGGPGSLSSAGNQLWHQDSPGVEDMIEPDIEFFGQILASADFDGNGADDLVIGVPDEEISDLTDAGVVHVLYGKIGVGVTAKGDQLWSQEARGVDDAAGTYDNFGRALATGDFDGDGFADLVVGAHQWMGIGGGAVHVFYGSAGGLSAAREEWFHQDKGTLKEQLDDTQHESFSAALATGDFDGDGFDDIAIGAPTEDVERMPTGSEDAGAVHILYGSVQGITSVRNELWVQPKLDHPDMTIEKDLFGSHFGSSLAAGDFDGNGADDLVIGAEWHDEGRIDNLGVVHVAYGVVGVGPTNVGNQFWTQDSEGILDSAAAFESFGYRLGVGDFDGDGVDDLAISVLESVDGKDSAGAVHVLSGVGGVGLNETGDQFWTHLSEGVGGEPEGFAYFGISLTGADFDGDGMDDLAIGSSGETVSGIDGAGAVHVLHGAATGGVTATGAEDWSQDSD